MRKGKKVIIGAVAVVLAVALATVATSWAKNDKADKPSRSKSDKVKEFKEYEKPAKGQTNASIHKEKIGEVTTDLLDVAETEKNKGQQKREEKMEEKQLNNPDAGEQEREREEAAEELEEIAQDLEVIAEETEEAAEETAKALEKAEKENGFKKFLVGTDYKNLGQLRSSLVHNRNQIRKLAYLAEKAPDEETEAQISQQLTKLMQERTRIKEMISEKEEGFSLLGWIFRFMNGYPDDSINEEDEADLEDDVVEAIEAIDDEEAENIDGDNSMEEETEEEDEKSTEEGSGDEAKVETPADNSTD